MGLRLREIFTPLLSYVVLLARTPAEQQRPFSDLRGRIGRLLDERAVLAKRHDIAAKDFEEASFAAVAWIDEQVLTATAESNREVYDAWRRSPLQAERYDTANAGEEFFDHLEALGPQQNEAREIYHLCLCLGFRGRYYDDSQEYKLVELRRHAAQHLSIPVLDMLEVEKSGERVTPQPYAVKPPVAKPPRRPISPLLIGLALAAVAALLLLVFWPSGPELPERTREDILADAKGVLSGFACSRVSATDFQAETGELTLTGTVESSAQQAKMREAVLTVVDVTTVQENLSILPRPFCAVIELLEPYREQGDTLGTSLAVKPQNGCDIVYHANDSLVVDVSAQHGLQYVYVDYFVADRVNAAHLLPNPRENENFLDQGTHTTIGGPQAAIQWQVEPPFGLELITAVTSPEPLFAEPRPAAEGALAYIDDLRESLAKEGLTTKVAATYCLITTAE